MSELLDVPDGLEECEHDFCSQFDGVINREVADLLTKGEHYADYPSYNWYGTVWHADGQFHCKVMRYLAHVDTVSADSPEELQQNVCNVWGWE